jgi:soluble lytic murein transglycosylase-like protein
MTTAAIVTWIGVYSSMFGIDPKTALAVAQHESQLNPNAVGNLGEIGLFQLRPEFNRKYTVRQLKNPVLNIKLGVEYLAKMKKQCIHKRDLNYLVCYNMGMTKARTVKHPELFPYVKSVIQIMLARREK